MNIKGHEFGNGKPVVCVPVIEQTREAILIKVREMEAENVEMIEWRMDWFEQVASEDKVAALLEELRDAVKETVLLCTFRSQAQGGQRSLGREQYQRLNLLVAQTGVPDMIDLEFYEEAKPCQAIEALRRAGVKVVCSNHDFHRTPALAEMQSQLEDMVAAGADFAKLAVTPGCKRDVLRLMDAVLAVKELHPDRHFIAMSMGADGAVSRILGEWYGSEVTFGAFGKSSAPGQVEYGRLGELLDKLNCLGQVE